MKWLLNLAYSLAGRMRYVACLTGCLATFTGAMAQTPFACEGQLFAILAETNELVEVVINPVNKAIQPGAKIGTLPVPIEAIGFRSADGLLYGVGPVNQHLYRIDSKGTVEDLGKLSGVDPSYTFAAGDVSPNGRYLYVVAASGGTDQALVRIDLTDNAYPVSIQGLPGVSSINDIAFHPYQPSRIYAYDAKEGRFARIELGSESYSALTPINQLNDIYGPYFTAFGELRAYGTTAGGVTNALFDINQTTGIERMMTNGPPTIITDIAACPFGVELRSRIFPEETFPCLELDLTVTIANGSGSVLSSIDLAHHLPLGMYFKEIVSNPYGGTVEWYVPTNTLHIRNMTVRTGVDSIRMLVELIDVPEGKYGGQGMLSNLPAHLGLESLSDNPRTLDQRDTTFVRVTRIEEDSIEITRFVCLGDSIVLDGSTYGNDLHWSNNHTGPQIVVYESGNYLLEARTGCQTIYVNHAITVASCPFTIELGHAIIPRETLACSEVLFRYYVDNASGVTHKGLSLIDTLPAGFNFVELWTDPFGGRLAEGMPDNLIEIIDITLPAGIDSFDVLVHVGDVAPGFYRNRAVLSGLPQNIGPIRFSDDPSTPGMDSTTLEIYGTGTDSLYLERQICSNEALILDATTLGTDHQWDDGSSRRMRTISAPGNYSLIVFNGCNPTYVYYTVVPADDIAVWFDTDERTVRLGDSLHLAPLVSNAGQNVSFTWSAADSSAIPCPSCPEITLRPLSHTSYQVIAANEVCRDTAVIAVTVDNDRRLYVPNAFSPNRDGVNDHFYIQSPDFGSIGSLTIVDRWGSVVHTASEGMVNEVASGWDGTIGGQPLPAGVYMWKAEITYLDGAREIRVGQVTLVR